MRARSELMAIAIALALAFALALTEAAQVVLTYDGVGSIRFRDVLARGLPAWLLLGGLAPLVALACRRWRLDLAPLALARHVALATAFASLHIVLLAAFKVSGRWPALAFSEAVKSAVFYNLVADVLIYWAIAGLVQVVDDARRLRQREAEALQLQAQLSEARLDALRAQLRPHFLYNVLNTAAMLARAERGADTVSVLAKLGELLRYVLRDHPGDEATLGDEVAFLRRYLELEQLRFADRLQVEIDLDPALAELRLPALLLQPLVENAVRHGIAQRPGAGRLSIRARRARRPGDRGGAQVEHIEIEICDDGPGLARGAPADDDADADGDGIGLANTRARLRQRYGAAGRLELEPLDGGGTCARVILPTPAVPA